MKAAIPMMLAIVALTGCATLGSTQGGSAIVASGDVNAEPTSPAASNPFPPQDTDIGPRLIIPLTGGPPVIGIPLGGDLFLPLTVGPPLPGIPTSP
jgi:hypothetical protein